MEKLRTHGIYIAIIVIILSWSQCNRPEGKTVTVTIPEKHGTFTPIKPEQIVITNTKIITDHSQAKTVANLLRQNDSLARIFAKAPDTVKITQYADAISIREYKHTFEDTTVKIDLNGLVRGEVQTMACNWVVKPQHVKVDVRHWHVLAGVEIGSKQSLDQFGIKANLRFQSKSGSLFSAGYDNKQTIWVGIDRVLF